MTITTKTLTYAFFIDSAIFVIISLFFFAYCIKTICRVHDLVESVIDLITRFEETHEGYKHEGTD